MVNHKKLAFSEAVKFHINLMRMQMALEDVFIEVALNADVPTIILCDRGVMDASAYIDENIWQAILDETGWSTIQLRDRRYDAVIHMVTAANGATDFYHKESKGYNKKTIEEAIDLDKKLINAWVGHPHFSIIDNRDRHFK